MDVVRPRWSAWSFLAYAGGLAVLGAAAGWLDYFAAHSGTAGYVGWALLVFVVLAAAAEGLRRSAHRVTAGVFALVALVGFVAFVSALWTWFGWRPNSSSSGLHGFHVSQLALELIWLIAAVVVLRRFRAPLIVAQVALAAWLFVADFISNGGDWSAIVSIAIGLAFLVAAGMVDRAYGFWLHAAAGLAIGGGFLFFWHTGNFEWTLIVLLSIAYVFFARTVGRSSWAVLGTLGLLFASVHFSLEWAHVSVPFFSGGNASSRGWVPPLVFTCTGALLVLLALMLGRRSSGPS